MGQTKEMGNKTEKKKNWKMFKETVIEEVIMD